MPIYTTWSITTLLTSHFLLSLKHSQTVRQSWMKQTDLSMYCIPTDDLSHQPSSKPIEMELRRDWKGKTPSGESPPSLDSRAEMAFLRTQYKLPSGRGICAPHAPIVSETVLVRSQTSTSQDHCHYMAFAAVDQRRGFGSWWWWLLGRDAVVESQMVEVDVNHAEWWDEWEDRGPGWQESKIGKYDGWL